MLKGYVLQVEQAADYILSKISIKPEIGIILGSGLGSLAEQVEDAVEIEYSEIPNFPISTVIGHAGKMVIGLLEQKPVMILQGRFHYYEGYSMKEVTFAVRVMKLLGMKDLIVTNAAGGINTGYKAGDLMLIKDHINFSGVNPLIGQNYSKFGVRFPDMTEAYTGKLINIAKFASQNLDIELKEGVYLYASGPSYETPAEIKMFRLMGADAVGMSTVPEVIAARHSDMNVLGISCIANLASGVMDAPLSHKDVLEAMANSKDKFTGLIREIVRIIR